MVGSNKQPYPKCVCGHARNKHGQRWNRYSDHSCSVNNCDCKKYVEVKI
jgi:hypothetical protein